MYSLEPCFRNIVSETGLPDCLCRWLQKENVQKNDSYNFITDIYVYICV